MFFVLVFVVIGLLTVPAQDVPRKGLGPGAGNCNFIDENGDGINDNFRDHDGDGIPNHLDPDWTRPKDGSGYRNGNLRSFREARSLGQGFGNGICDGAQQRIRIGGKGAGQGRRN